MTRIGFLAAAALSMTAVGCGGRFLIWKASPPAAAMAGKVTIEASDMRPGPQGGDKKVEVGSQPGPFMIPTPIEVEGPTAVADSMRDFVGDAAKAAGIGVAAAGETTAGKIKVQVLNLWCNYTAIPFVPFLGNVTLKVEMVPAGSENPTVTEVITAESGALASCQDSLKEALNKANEKLVPAFGTPAWKNAVSGAPAAPAATP